MFITEFSKLANYFFLAVLTDKKITSLRFEKIKINVFTQNRKQKPSIYGQMHLRLRFLLSFLT
jgi:hypothetical protein